MLWLILNSNLLYFQPEDGGDEWDGDSKREGDYDAFNDETFGNNALDSDDDWEESHERLTSIREAEKKKHSSLNNHGLVRMLYL